MRETQSPEPLISLIYASAASGPISRDTLQEILATARERNAAYGVTGMLLYIDGSFFQVLEGHPEAVHELYARIAGDRRHTQTLKLLEEEVQERSFAQWSMGYAEVTREELQALPGCNDFFLQGRCFHEMKANTSRKLLEAFREGRWRRQVH